MCFGFAVTALVLRHYATPSEIVTLPVVLLINKTLGLGKGNPCDDEFNRVNTSWENTLYLFVSCCERVTGTRVSAEGHDAETRVPVALLKETLEQMKTFMQH